MSVFAPLGANTRRIADLITGTVQTAVSTGDSNTELTDKLLTKLGLYDEDVAEVLVELTKLAHDPAVDSVEVTITAQRRPVQLTMRVTAKPSPHGQP